MDLAAGAVWLPLCVTPPPLDSGFRRNDELRGRNYEATPRLMDERLLGESIFVPAPNPAGDWT